MKLRTKSYGTWSLTVTHDVTPKKKRRAATVARLQRVGRSHTAEGRAECSLSDPFNPKTGRRVAFARAMAKLPRPCRVELGAAYNEATRRRHPQPATIFIGKSGLTVVANKDGAQMPTLQVPWLVVYAQWLESKGVDPSTVPHIEIEGLGFVSFTRIDGRWHYERLARVI